MMNYNTNEVDMNAIEKDIYETDLFLKKSFIVSITSAAALIKTDVMKYAKEIAETVVELERVQAYIDEYEKKHSL